MRVLPVLLITVLGVAWAWASRLTPASAPVAAPQAGFAAPDFELPTLTGSTARLSDWRGQVVVVNLWASWCGPCRAEMPALQRVAEHFAGQGVVVVGLNATTQDSRANAAAFVAEQGLTFPIVLDVAGTASAAYQLRALPSTYIVDKHGVISAVLLGGPLSEATLRAKIAEALTR